MRVLVTVSSPIHPRRKYSKLVNIPDAAIASIGHIIVEVEDSTNKEETREIKLVFPKPGSKGLVWKDTYRFSNGLVGILIAHCHSDEVDSWDESWKIQLDKDFMGDDKWGVFDN